jgi:hypothetical protein
MSRHSGFAKPPNRDSGSKPSKTGAPLERLSAGSWRTQLDPDGPFGAQISELLTHALRRTVKRK